ncbi:membrane protein containing SNARE domain protein [Rhodopirellula maiorica SM1]|uniref:Membrane protein containing SNARE domain protein n=1 Tax=Rhodopirellula maiorica SM1 TaxID=1265738 RepID=M5RG46_9BACT|nr:VTT domain-containing protein [Rhodopirellula maiorica]EMI18300.1 membrane protein containing SNARE domain protein [Rhodopirellula maiorica SM1]
MRELFRTLPLMCVVLLVPVLPFLLFGGRIEDWLRGVAEDPPSMTATAALIIGLLATDILLPIPSSVVSTLSGWQLGWWRGTIATWIGMNLGAAIGFALTRRWGKPFALWFSRGEDLQRMQTISDRYGPYVLIITRAVPVFAEASVLIAGIHQLSWRRFLPAVVFSNLGIAIAYSIFGDFAERHQWLPLALGVSVAVPVLVAAAAKRYLPQ